MKKLLCTLVILALVTLMTALAISAKAFYCPTDVMDEAIRNNDFERIFVEYFFPSLSPRQTVIFGSELNLSNGRPEHENGERYMFGRLESAGSALRMEAPEVLYERVRDEALRLLFGPWAQPGGTTFKLLRRAGQALDLTTGQWRPYSGPALIVHHTTEWFGGQRSRLLTFTYDGLNCGITILRVK